ncbi:Uncharacterized phage-encoded protein [[Eubacterium] contortum]|uniref:Uncharacterized phage-encoded protein n=1 Tax=Faecalicatena contorta TaxID=39482 RepID=A0A174JJL6_9FIRM|nr:Rha family transcriptional regulator [Faecalicatena contorta]CUO99893.1 Uncharacterized phage-encoded protein [[Eubacterium] contortum] [Faecalicatena contorta]
MEKIEQTISSIEVAEMVGKEHKELLRDIRRYVHQMNQSNLALVDFFTESTYKDGKGETRPCYNITKKGCEFIAHKLTGIKGTEFTAKYINRFHDMEDAIKSGYNLSELSPELQAIFFHDKKIQIVEQRVDKLENTMNIDYAQQKQLKDFVSEVVVNALGGRAARAYTHKDENGVKIRPRVYSRLWHDFYDYFNINAYANLPRVRFDEALEYINRWQPPTNMQLEIGKINREVA